jgi:hypothetical protein
VLWYGGLGLTIILACLTLESIPKAQPLLRRAAQIGEASFFVFVLQFYVYLAIILPFNTRLPMPGLWPMYLVVSVGVVIAAAIQWQKRGWNRFLTVGYRRFQEHIDSATDVVASAQYNASP